MANTELTKVSFFRAFYLCFLLLLRPSIFKEIEEKDDKLRESQKRPNLSEPRCFVTRRAFFSSFSLTITATFFGAIPAIFLSKFFKHSPSTFILSTQFVSALVLLWAILFVRGWDIQSWGGVTLTERVNQWLYRGMCFIGTVFLIFSLTLH